MDSFGHMTNIGQYRQRILTLKEIPPMPGIAQRILAIADDADIDELSRLIKRDPPLAARLVGLANSAYFGWPGGVHTINDAIYKVLGMKLVVSLVTGLALNTALDTCSCPGFRPERYWFSAITTAIMAQNLYSRMPPALKSDMDNVYLSGLLHSLGIAVLVHLFPQDMGDVFARADGRREISLAECVDRTMGITPHVAGGWLAHRWHLPTEVVHVMKHYAEPDYRMDHWPSVLLVGYCACQAGQIFATGEMSMDLFPPEPLGITTAAIESASGAMVGQIEEIKLLAYQMAKSGGANGQ